MNWMVLYFGLQAGLWSGGVNAMSAAPGSFEGSWFAPRNATEVSADFRLAFLDDHLELTGLLRSYQIQDGPASFYPFRMDYGVGAALKFGAVSFHVDHECDHAWPYLPFCGTPKGGNFDSLAGWHTEVSVRVEGSAHLF